MMHLVAQRHGTLVRTPGVVLLQLLFLTTLEVVQCISLPEFLIDDRFSLVISGDPGGNYFGASAALYRSPGSTAKTWIYIGEPKANNTPLDNIEPGTVWRCEVNDLEKKNLDCASLSPQNIAAKVANPLGRSWFGGSIVTASGGSLITSAHHLVTQDKQSSKYGMPGACYLLRRGSNNFQSLMVPDKYFQNEEKLAAFGISLHVVNKNDATDTNKIISGAPVFHYGFGAVGTVNIDGDSPSISWTTSGEQPDSYFGYAVSSGKYFGGKEIYYAGGLPRANDLKGQVILFSPPPCPTEPCSKTIGDNKILLPGFHVGSYFGSSLFSLDLDVDGSEELLVGAPMSCYWDNLDKIRNEQTENSEDADSRKRNLNYRDNGCVYVYKMTSQKAPQVVQILLGGKAPYARFGSTISALENFQSIRASVIVVGAPYENDNGGAVYFYEGSKILKTGEHFKKISAGDTFFSSLPQKLQGLGYSLSRSTDTDGNETPDIVIGSYHSGQALVVRTRQHMQILPTKVSFKLSEDERTPAEVMKNINYHQTESQLVVTVTCKFDISEPQVTNRVVQENLVVWSRLKVDPGFGRFDLSMQNPSISHSKKNSHSIEFAVNIAVSNFRTANQAEASVIVFMKLIQEYDDNEIPPLKMSVQSWFNQSANIPLNTLTFDIHKSSQQGNAEYHFRPFLPAPNSNEERFYSPIPIIYACKIPDSCVANVVIIDAGFFVMVSGKYKRIERLAVGSSSEVILRWKLSNFAADKADSPSTLLTWKHPNMKLVSETCISSRPNIQGPSYWCNRTGTLPPSKKRNITVEAKFEIQSKFLANTNYNNLSVSLETYYFHSNQFKDQRKVELELFVDSKVILRGTSSETSLEDLTVSPKIGYQVLLNGSSSIERIELNFEIPTKRRHDLETLIDFYQEDVKTLSGGFQSHRCIPSEPFFGLPSNSTQHQSPPTMNPIDVQPTEKSSSNPETTTNKYVDAGRRKRRNVNEHLRVASRLTFDLNSTIVLDCSEETEPCVKIKCSFENVQAKTNFRIEFRLNIRNYTANLLNDTLDTLLISSTGNAQILEGSQRARNISEVKIIKNRPVVASPPPVWIYIVAVVGGLIFLLVLFAILYKCGFFKREFKQKLDELKSPPEAIAGEANTEGGEDLPLRESSSSERLLDS